MFDLLKNLLLLADPLFAFIAGFIALRVTSYFLKPKTGWWYWGISYVIHLVAANTIIYIGVGDYLPVLLVFSMFVVGICLLYQGDLLARFSIGVILVILPLSFNGVLMSFRPPYDDYFYTFVLLYWCIIHFFVKRAVPAQAQLAIRSKRIWLLVDFLALMPLTTVLAVTSLTQPEYPDEAKDLFTAVLVIPQEEILIMVSCLAVIAALSLLAAIVVFSRHEQLTQEQQLWQLRNQYYQSVEEAQQQVRYLRHDLANHLTVLAGLEGAALQDYLQELLDSPALQNGRRYCRHEVVNAVLATKASMMLAQQIEYDFEVALADQLPVTDIDLCALFGNSLDNAIEANLKLPPAQRKLALAAKQEQGFFVLELRNPLAEALSMAEGRILTTKKDKQHHGLGLAGMREIVARHQGSLVIETQDQEFCLRLLIPLAPACDMETS